MSDYRVRIGKALRMAAEALESAAARKERRAKRKRDAKGAEAELIADLGVTCIHDGGGDYCDWVRREGFVRGRCPLGSDRLRTYCSRPKNWSK